MVDADYNIKEGNSINVLDVPASRKDLTSAFWCHASNNQRTDPLKESHNRNVTCKYILRIFLFGNVFS